MLTIVAILLVLLLLGYNTYTGFREGAFYATYVFTRTLIGLLIALTFCEPLAALARSVFDADYPWYDYFVLISFALLFVATTTTIRHFKVRATSPSVPCIGFFDTLYGAAVGFGSGVLQSGVILVAISLIPALPFMSPSISRFEMAGKPLDTGGRVLALYDFASNRFGGDDFPLDADEGEPVTEEVNYNGKYDFPQEDYDDRNDNGRWDPGWLVRYRTCWHFGTVEAHRLGYPLGTGTEEETDEE